MTRDIDGLVDRMRKQRKDRGLSIRQLATEIGVSFSSLARIERREGDPDNNSTVRILEWLGELNDPSSVGAEKVAQVHFRAAKNIRNKTVQCLLDLAELLSEGHVFETLDNVSLNSEMEPERYAKLSKSEMERLATWLRSHLEASASKPFPALKLNIEGVSRFKISELDEPADCIKYLCTHGANDWSAMTIPCKKGSDKWIVLRNDTHNIERQKVTYLEECWHILLGHSFTKVAKVGEEYGRTFASAEEHDAFYLATATLLPKEEFEELLDSGANSDEIAKQFEVSKDLVEYRIKRLGRWHIYKDRKIGLSEEE